MRRGFLVPVVLVLFLALTGTVMAAPAANLFPEDTFLYVEADVNAFESGVRQLDLAKMIQDPEIRDCLKPMLQKIGLDTENPIETMLGMLPTRQWLDGHVALGIRGVTVTTEGPDGTLKKTLVSPSQPLDVRLFHDVAGMFASAKLGAMFRGTQGHVTLRIQPDMLMTLKPGARLKGMVEGFLSNPPPHLVQKDVVIGDRQVKHVTFRIPIERDLFMEFQAFADFSGDTWILGTDRDTFLAALGGGPRKSLGASAPFDTVRKRLSAGGQIAWAYMDVAKAMSMISAAFPPLVMQEAELLGLTSIRGFGTSISMAHGGVRESSAFVFDGRPRGIFSLLDAMPGGLSTDDVAPASTAAMMAVKFDMSILHQRIKELAAVLVPGTEKYVDPAVEMASDHIGLDILGDFLPALGDEMSVMVFPPQGTMIPQAVMLVKVRDAEKFNRVLEVAKGFAESGGIELRRLPMTDGEDGFWFSAPGLPIQPSFAVRNGYLVGAMGAAQLRSFVRGWGDVIGSEETLAKDEIYQHVLKALGAGQGERLAAFGYVNLRRSIPPALNTALPFAGMLDGIEEFIDLALVPPGDVVGDHMSGLGWAIQRDGDAISFDVFSPTGLSTLGAAAAVFFLARQEDMAEEMRREVEEMEREIEEARREAERAEHEKVPVEEVEPDRDNEPFVGFNAQTMGTGGVQITGIIPGTPAEAATLMVGDVIVKIENVDIPDFDTFRTEIMKYKPNQRVTLGVKRGDRMIFFQLTLGRRGDFVK